MNTQSYPKILVAPALLLIAVFLVNATPAMAEDSTSGSDWEYGVSLYMWGPSMNIDTPPGLEVEIPFYQILNDLKMTMMGDFSMKNDDWSFMTDVIYMKLKQKNIHDPENAIIGLADLTSSVQMKSWIISPTVGYALYNQDNTRVEVFGGLRYLWIDLGVQISSQGNPVFNQAADEGFWDGIIGFRANVGINEKWFVPASIDVGGGNSKNTWQALAGIGYNFGKYNTSLTYRYLSWKFDNVPAMEKLIVKGPMLNFNITF